MSAYHHKSFTDFALTGKSKRHGALRMKGSAVYSYATCIALVDREKRSIRFDGDKYSRTTSMHQGAITLGLALHLEAEGWTLITECTGQRGLSE